MIRDLISILLILSNLFRPKSNVKHHITKGSGSPTSPTFAPSSPNSPDDMSSSLLRPSSDVENNYIFGKFRGFTMKPLPSAKITSNAPKVAYVHPVSKTNHESDLHIVPTREAPPPPVIKQGVNSAIDKFNNINAASAPPALPPLNKGSTARPIISNPILEGSTCDAKEVPSVVKYPTIRPAPAPPKNDQKIIFDENVVPEVLINPTSTVEKKPKDGTLSRIQSFLKKDSSPKPEKIHKQLKAFDKEKLKDLHISSPILITQVPLKDASEDEERKSKINRAQSMRDPPSPPIIKPLTSTASMRQPRPKSIVDRPTLPPPPRPPAPAAKIPPIAQPELSPNEYDDCESREAGTPDNIYAVIEESPKSPPSGTFNTSIESMGLLSEIVNEIEHRNVDSIYIASTLNKKRQPGYANAKSLDDEYSGDAESTTSSGYMRPIGAPIARIPPSQSVTKMPSTTSSNSLSSFKSAKSASTGSSGQKNVTSPEAKVITFDGPMKKSNSDLGKKTSPPDADGGYKTPMSNKPLDDKKSADTTIGPRRPSLKKTITPPSITLPKKAAANNLRSPSPTKRVTSVTRVPSKPKTLQKPAVVKAPLKPSPKTSSLTNGIVKTPAGDSSSASKVLSAAANKKSNVAALQQKFESANP